MYRVEFSLSVIRLSCPFISVCRVCVRMCTQSIFICTNAQKFKYLTYWNVCSRTHAHTRARARTHCSDVLECNEVKTCTCICLYICNKFISDEISIKISLISFSLSLPKQTAASFPRLSRSPRLFGFQNFSLPKFSTAVASWTWKNSPIFFFYVA